MEKGREGGGEGGRRGGREERGRRRVRKEWKGVRLEEEGREGGRGWRVHNGSRNLN